MSKSNRGKKEFEAIKLPRLDEVREETEERSPLPDAVAVEGVLTDALNDANSKSFEKAKLDEIAEAIAPVSNALESRVEVQDESEPQRESESSRRVGVESRRERNTGKRGGARRRKVRWTLRRFARACRGIETKVVFSGARPSVWFALVFAEIVLCFPAGLVALFYTKRAFDRVALAEYEEGAREVAKARVALIFGAAFVVLVALAFVALRLAPSLGVRLPDFLPKL